MIAFVSSAVVPVAAAALRGLAAALAVAGGITVLRLRHVVAQKAAWTLVLAGAMLMPLTSPWLSPWLAQQNWLPAWPPGASTVGSKVVTKSKAWLESFSSFNAHAEAKAAAPVRVPGANQMREASAPSYEEPAPVVSASALTVSAETASIPAVERTSTPQELTGPLGPQYPPRAIAAYATRKISPILTAAADATWAFYLVVAIALLGRLFYGLIAAMRLWKSAWPIQLAETSIPVRVHSEITSPVTIGSGVLLPADYAEWDSDKLGIVLAHESSHVRQRDFYLQFAAGLYAAIFWFSPLGWWLKRKLSNLSEAISDHAAVAQAASRTSYAQILLEFASRPHTNHFETTLGVAMARKERITERIEWLLNETRFRQAFAGGRSRILAAIILAPLAVFAATALVRVEAKAQQAPAAQQTNPAQQTAPAQAPASAPQNAQATTTTGVSHPDDTAITIPPAPATPDIAPIAVPVPAPVPTPTPTPVVVTIPPVPALLVSPDVSVSVGAIHPDVKVFVGAIHPDVHVATSSYANVDTTSYGRGYSYAYGSSQSGSGQDKGDSYAVITKNGQHERFTGNDSDKSFEKARQQAHGDFFWFKRDGKEYIVEDPAVIARIHDIYLPMDQLGEQMKALSKQHREDAVLEKADVDRELAASGFNQAELERQTAEMRAREPEFQKQMADLSAQMAKMQVPKIAPIDQKQLDDLKRQMAQLQATQPDFDKKLSELINKMVSLEMPKINAIDQQKLAELSEKMAEVSKKFGDDEANTVSRNVQYKIDAEAYSRIAAKMSQIGAAQGKLGGEMGRMAGEADKQMRSIIDESVKDGKARPVQ
ncbi:M56 family metallopeptidase [Terracidiphilus sp.]|uniref:M56 family metallopeptidase n=1 Tax=Terracidiphilus sp. TaxID=1964191 RepID=UPI003C13045C